MALIADIFLTAGALAAGFYCFILSRRLRRFTDLERGVGGAIAVLSVQVDDLSKALKQAEAATANSANSLSSQSQSAEAMAKRLELLIASLHDLPEPNQVRRQRPIEPLFVRQPLVGEDMS
ncbi:hypothetical protein OAH97_01660 [Octadecabacter sp.]|nr:hypothetical protein [Octadecabacter sp.]